MTSRAGLALPFALASALLLPALPAAADDDDDDRPRGRRWHRGHHDHGHGHRHHRGCGHAEPWHGRGHRHGYVVKHHDHGYGRRYPVYFHAPPPGFFCGPCSHPFASYDALSFHVHRHHHVAVIELPFVIFQASVGGAAGWVYDY